MTLLRMPMFCWTTLVTSVLLLFSIPVVTAGLMMLFIDRNYGGGFFDPALGGNPILWQHVFWFFGHPEVYILILPAFGIVSEIIPVFSRKPLFGYKAFVFATASIGALGFTRLGAPHVHDRRGLPALLRLLHVPHRGPTGVKFFNWLATMWGGKLRFDTPMLFAVGFIALFLIGGLDGAFLAVGALRLHGPGHVLGRLAHPLRAGRRLGRSAIFAATLLLVPQDDRPMLDERLGKVQFWLAVHRHQPGLLPAAPAGPRRHDPAHRRLLPQRRLDGAQLPVHDRRVRHRASACCPSCGTSSSRLRGPRTRRRRPVGRQHPGVGDHQPAAGLQLRPLPPRSAPSARSSTSSTPTAGARAGA